MTYTVPTSLPTTFTAGMTWRWDESLAEYPASEGWTFTRRFIGATNARSVTAVASGDTYQFTLAASDTGMPAGDYRVEGWVELAGNKYPVSSASVRVSANPASVTPGDHRSHAERMVAMLEAELEARAAGGTIESYSVGGQSISRFSLAEIEAMLSRFRQKLRVERGLGFGTTVKFEFTEL